VNLGRGYAAVVRHLRANGVMRGVIASGTTLTSMRWLPRRGRFADGLAPIWPAVLAPRRSTSGAIGAEESDGDTLLTAAENGDGKQMHVVAYDFGIKENILRMLRARTAA